MIFRFNDKGQDGAPHFLEVREIAIHADHIEYVSTLSHEELVKLDRSKISRAVIYDAGDIIWSES